MITVDETASGVVGADMTDIQDVAVAVVVVAGYGNDDVGNGD